MISTATNKSSTQNTQPVGNIWTRRGFLSLAGWGGFLTVIGGFKLAFMRFMFPRVLFEPTPIIVTGYPDEFIKGDVSTKYLKDYQVWIVRDDTGIFAILAICTHLGCTPNWLPSERKFKCPCHGSGFTMDGVNFEGPAPRPLERLKIALGPDGRIVIDKSKKYLYEKGEWGTAGSLVKI